MKHQRTIENPGMPLRLKLILTLGIASLVVMLILTACAPSEASPTATSVPVDTATVISASTTTTPAIEDQVESDGAKLWQEKPCKNCHGALAGGGRGRGPKLAGTTLSIELVKNQIRSPRAIMPSYSDDVVTDAELDSIYEWLIQLD